MAFDFADFDVPVTVVNLAVKKIADAHLAFVAVGRILSFIKKISNALSALWSCRLACSRALPEATKHLCKEALVLRLRLPLLGLILDGRLAHGFSLDPVI